MTTGTISQRPGSAPASPAQRLQTTMAAVRVSFTWLGVRKTLTPGQKARAAETFGAKGQYLSAAKKLLDTKNPAFKAVTAVKNRAAGYWKAMSLPFPEPGIRLIRQDQVGRFDEQMTAFRQELGEAVENLDRHYEGLRTTARERLGQLYDPADYPPSLGGLFEVMWDFPSVEPPAYLMQLNPALYEQERRRMVGRFEEAVRQAEEVFVSHFGRLISHLTERLSGDADGKAKVFRDSAIENLHGFFERFRSLNVQSNAQLDELVDAAQQAVRGVKPQALRDDQSLRQEISTRLSEVQASLDSLLVDRPRRRIIRPRRKEAVA